MFDHNKILLVEDHAESRRILSFLLRRKGFCVVDGATVAEGVAGISNQAVALLDLDLPDGFGTEVLAQIRKQSHHTKVAFITAVSDPERLSRLMALSADAVFKKPIDFNVILDWINKAVEPLPAVA